MSTKIIIWLAMFIGSIIGGYIPVLFGASLFSYSSILFNGVGGIIGVLVGVKLGQIVNG
jgi:hypothetical protein